MTVPLDDAAVTALVKQLQGTSMNIEMCCAAADALERLATDLAATRAELRAYARLVDKDDATEMRVIDWESDEKRVEDLYNRVQMAEATAWRLTQVEAERDAARAEADGWSSKYREALAAFRTMRAERDTARVKTDSWRLAEETTAERLRAAQAERDDLRRQLAAAEDDATIRRAERDKARAEWQRLHDLAAQYRAERDDLRRQVAAVRALCEAQRQFSLGGASNYDQGAAYNAWRVLAALDSAGQTEGEGQPSCDKPGPHATHDGCEGVPWPEASALPSAQIEAQPCLERGLHDAHRYGRLDAGDDDRDAGVVHYWCPGQPPLDEDQP